jgi:hypothetical protein
MRQTEMDGVCPVMTGRPEGRPVAFELPLRLRATSQDGVLCHVVITQEHILIERPVAGLSCKVRMPVSALEGVTAAFLPDGPAVRLVHREAELTLDVLEAASLEMAIASRDRLARALGLPALFVDADGAIFGASRRFGRIVTGMPGPRRGGRPAFVRRPRFLTRRVPGRRPEAPPITGREIIART